MSYRDGWYSMLWYSMYNTVPLKLSLAPYSTVWHNYDEIAKLNILVHSHCAIASPFPWVAACTYGRLRP